MGGASGGGPPPYGLPGAGRTASGAMALALPPGVRASSLGSMSVGALMDMFRRMVGDLGASLMALEGAEGMAVPVARNRGGGGGQEGAAGALAVLRGQVASFRTVLRYLSLVNDEVPRCAGRGARGQGGYGAGGPGR